MSNKKIVTKEYLESQNKKALVFATNMQDNSKKLGSLIGEMLRIGKNGQLWLIAFTKIQKDAENQPALDCIERQSKRFFRAEEIDLSIKGLGIKTEAGRKAKVEITPKEKPSNKGSKKSDEDLLEDILKLIAKIKEKNWALEQIQRVIKK